MTGITKLAQAAGTPAAAASTQTAADKSGSDFSEMLKDTLENQLLEKSVTLGASESAGLGGGMMSSDGGVMNMLMSAAATGNVGQAEIALFMLCAMMQNSQSSEFSPLMGAMASMMGSMGTNAGSVYKHIMDSDYDPYVLATVDEKVFGADSSLYSNYSNGEKNEYSEILAGVEPGSYGARAKSLPDQAWKPAAPAVTGGEGDRSPAKLRQVIDQFSVETAERYRPYRRGGDTYCNIFLWDVTGALGCEIPHYVDAGTGVPRGYPDIKGAVEMGANATHDWLIERGAGYGWREVGAEEAQAAANGGLPAVTAWKNPAGRSGHVQVVCPSQDGRFDPERGVAVAQAGSSCRNYAYASSVFSESQLDSVRYFIHD